MSEEFTAGIVKEAVETDEATFARVLPDQVCDRPLIPKKHPIRQLEWRITLSKGTVYLPKEGLYARAVEIGYGSWINGGVFGRDYVKIEGGQSLRGCGLANGSVISEGEIRIIEPASKMEDYADGFLYIKGDIIGKSIEISVPTIVYGNVIADERIIVRGKTIVGGGVLSKNVQLIDTTCCYVYGENVRLKSVSLFLPVVYANNELEIELVRVITKTCKECAESYFDCNFKDCERCVLLTDDDILDMGDYKIATNVWRAYVEDSKNYEILKEYLNEIYDNRKSEIDFGKLKYVGISRGLAYESERIVEAVEKVAEGVKGVAEGVEAVKGITEKVAEGVEKIAVNFEEIKNIIKEETGIEVSLEVLKKKEARVLQVTRILCEIIEKSREKNVKTEEFLRRFELIEEYLREEEELRSKVNEFKRRLEIELFEYVDEKHMEEVRKFSKDLLEFWIEKKLR